jgi:Bacterial inner membrane protein
MQLFPDAVGWAATAVFASSYFVKGPRQLRLVQAAAALVWIAYGVLIGSMPVIAANVIVSGLAVYSVQRTT